MNRRSEIIIRIALCALPFVVAGAIAAKCMGWDR